MTELVVAPRDPLVFRDGRTFDATVPGSHARRVSWPYPSVTAGFVRTALGRTLGRAGARRDPVFWERLLQVAVAGPFLMEEEEVYLPAPRDLVVTERKDSPDRKIHPVRPLPQTTIGTIGGVSMPQDELMPAMPDTADKAIPGPSFWSLSKMTEWLAADRWDMNFPGLLGEDAEAHGWPEGFTDGPATETRTSVSIDPETFRGMDGYLYRVEGMAFRQGERILLRASSRDPELADRLYELHGLHTLGGERRLAEMTPQDPGPSWDCPTLVRQALAGTETARMVLATPALFAQGWLPGWLDRSSLSGEVPGTGVRVKLASAVVGRFLPLSGWNMVERRAKPLRRMVPAGSVYFFRVTEGKAADLADHWLESVSDVQQDRLDGFGLAVWGTWQASREHLRRRG